MASISASQFFGGKVPPPPTQTVIHTPTTTPSIIDRLRTDFTNRTAQVQASKDRQTRGKQSGLSTVLQGAGQLAGAGADILKETVAPVINKTADVLSDIPAVQRSATNGAGGKILDGADSVTSHYREWAAQHPVAAKNLEATVNIASLLPGPKAVGVGLHTAEEAASNTTRAAAETISHAADSIKPLVERASDKVTPIERGVDTLLRSPETATEATKLSGKFNEYVSTAQKALADYSQPTPLEVAGTKAQKVLTSLSSKLKQIGREKSSVTDALGSKPVGNIVKQARTSLRSLVRDRLGLVSGTDGFFSETGRVAKVSDPADLKLLSQVDGKLQEIADEPTFRKVDDTIDYIQDLLFKRQGPTAVPVNTEVQGILKTVTRDLNGKLRDIGGPEYQRLNDAYGKTKNIYDTLNKGLGKDANKGASLMKQLFSPNGTMPRKLFGQIKDMTGVDLVQEATLAKFAMEHIGDVRQASLLEQILKGQVPTSKAGLVHIAADKILNKIQDPIGKARRTIEQSGT